MGAPGGDLVAPVELGLPKLTLLSPRLGLEGVFVLYELPSAVLRVGLGAPLFGPMTAGNRVGLMK